MAETRTHRIIGMTERKEVELRPPPEVDKEPNRICTGFPIYPGTVDCTLEPVGSYRGPGQRG